ncbi:MAG: polysaccharide deacetylase family protein [Candidatus Latescibacterota bacterium]|nr:MAG: polysaccharide deacetylase family protein [Candidatus Latescibacterota bacterium]
MHPALWAVAGAGTSALATSAAWAYWRLQLGAPPTELPPVLAYHKVGTAELGGTWCTRRQFRSQLDALRRAGYSAIDTRTFEERLTTLVHPPPGDARAPHTQPRETTREFLVTFDDAYASFATHAYPELQARGVPVLLFVISAFVGQRARWDLPLPGRRVEHLTWSTLRDLVADGVEIGSHTDSHRELRSLKRAALRAELVDSRRRLEDALGVEVRTLSYPFGACNARVTEAAAEAGYRLGFSMCPRGPNTRVHPLALRRWGVYVTDTPRSVLDKVDPSRRAFWVQDLITRGINAVGRASAAAAAIVSRS